MMSIALFFTYLVVLSATVIDTHGANLLISLLNPVESSHSKVFEALGNTLIRHGHRVTILTCSTVGTDGFRNGSYSKALQYRPQDIDFQDLQNRVNKAIFSGTLLEKMPVFTSILSMNIGACKSLFEENDALLDELKNSRFDVLIADAFTGCDTLIAAYLDIPMIAVTTSARYPFFHERIYGIPAPSSYVPFGFLGLSDRMSFYERVLSFVEFDVIMRAIGWMMNHQWTTLKDKHGISPDKDVRQLTAEAKLWLCLTNWAIDFPRPTAPNWIPIGGITDSPIKPLPEEFTQFVEESGEDGFIVFSLGMHFTHINKSSTAETFARVFSDLPQRVLWRHSGPHPRYLGNNTKLVDWLPQNDLLGHPKARLLIYHGGIHGIMEAVDHAVPMVIMPLFAEQASNAAKVESKGMGKLLRKEDVSYETVKATVVEVLENPVYVENVKRYSEIYRDRITDPAETAAFWIEHVIKYGDSHLRTRAIELNFVQLHSIDVLAFLTGVVMLLLAIMYAVIRRVLRWCFWKTQKHKTD